MNNNKLRIAAYCRVSTEKEEQASSLLAQQEFFNEYAAKNDCQLVKIYTDEGKSGTKFKNRPAFQAMMQDAKLGIFDCVYVKDISRLARNVVDFLQSVRSLKAMGVDCRFITSNMSLSDGELTLTILAAVAQEESANLSKRVKFGKKKNAENGKVPNFVFGYDKMDGDFFHLQINQTEADIIRQIFDLYTKMGYGTFKIAQILNNEGKTTKRGNIFSSNAVLRILKNRIYIGDVINGKEEICDFLTGRRQKNKPNSWNIAKDAVPPIISPETFTLAQNILEKKQQPFIGAQNADHLFSSLMICKICNSPFRQVVRQYKNTYKKWVCRGRNQNGVTYCSNNLVIDEAFLFHEIMRYIKSQIQNKNSFHNHICSYFLSLYKKHHAFYDISSMIKHKEELLKLRQKKLALFEADILSIEEVKGENKSIQLELEKIEHDIQDRKKENNSEFMECFIENYVKEAFIFSPNIMNHDTFSQIIKTIEVSPKEIIVIFKHFD